MNLINSPHNLVILLSAHILQKQYCFYHFIKNLTCLIIIRRNIRNRSELRLKYVKIYSVFGV